MIHSVQELAVIFALACAVFALARPIALSYGADADFVRRRNVWFVLTAVAFLSPNFWIFVLLSIPILVIFSRRDANPVAFYLFILHAVPSVGVAVPLPAFRLLFDVDFYRLLSFFVLVPAALRLRSEPQGPTQQGTRAIAVVLGLYGLLQVLVYVPPDEVGHIFSDDSPTNMLRRGVLYFIDVYLLFFVVSRSCKTHNAIAESLFAFFVSCLLLAATAVFETVRHWSLYAELITRWSSSTGGAYLMRDGMLRAQASAGNTLALGYLLAVGLGFWLYLRLMVTSRFIQIAVFTLLWLVFWLPILAVLC